MKQNFLLSKKELFTPFRDRAFKPIYYEEAQVIVSKYEDKIHLLNPYTWESMQVYSYPPDFSPKYFVPLKKDEDYMLLCLDIEGNLYNSYGETFKKIIPVGILVTSCTIVGENIALGLSNHTTVIYSYALNKLLKVFSCGHGSRISFLHTFDDWLFAFSDDGMLSVWKDLRLLKSLKFPSSSISFIAPYSKNSVLITCPDNSAVVLDLSDFSLKIMPFQIPLAGYIKQADSLILLDTAGLVYEMESERATKLYDLSMKVDQLIRIDDSNIFISDYHGTYFKYSYTQDMRLLCSSTVIPTDFSDLPEALLLSESTIVFPVNSIISVHQVGERISRTGMSLLGHKTDVLCITRLNEDMIATGSSNGELYFWSVKTGKLLLSTSNIHGITSILSIERDGCFILAIGSSSGYLKLIKVAHSPIMSISELWVSQCHQKDINSISYSAANGTFLTASQDKSLCFLSFAGKIISQVKHHKRGVWSVDCLKGLIATASADKTIQILSESHEVLHTIHGHDSAVTKVKFIDPSKLISGDANGIIKLWKISSKVEEIGSIDLMTGRIWSLFTYHNDILVIDSSGYSHILSITNKEAKNALTYNPMEDKLRIFVQQNDHLNSLRLSIELNKPEMAFSIMNKLVVAGVHLGTALESLPQVSIETLTPWVKDWIMHPRKNMVAQLLLDNIIAKDNSLASLEIQSIYCYTLRTLNRIDDLLSSSYSYKVIIDNK